MKKDQHCQDCGRAWPHPLLYDVRYDHTADPVGRCPQCAWFGDRQRRLPFGDPA